MRRLVLETEYYHALVRRRNVLKHRNILSKCYPLFIGHNLSLFGEEIYIVLPINCVAMRHIILQQDSIGFPKNSHHHLSCRFLSSWLNMCCGTWGFLLNAGNFSFGVIMVYPSLTYCHNGLDTIFFFYTEKLFSKY